MDIFLLGKKIKKLEGRLRKDNPQGSSLE